MIRERCCSAGDRLYFGGWDYAPTLQSAGEPGGQTGKHLDTDSHSETQSQFKTPTVRKKEGNNPRDNW